MIILGIDPGYAIVGYGIIEKKNSFVKALDYGAITTNKDENMADRLLKIYYAIKSLVQKHNPDAIAIEELFFKNNAKTAINVAQARGAIIVAGKEMGKAIYEYTPLQIKQALTGVGRAEKQQVQYMVKAVLNLSSVPKPDDTADALAVAITHSQTNQILGRNEIK